MLPLHVHLPITTPGLANRHLLTPQILMLITCYMHKCRLNSTMPGHMTLVMRALHLMPFFAEERLQVFRRNCGINHKAGTEEGIEMPKYGGPAVLVMLAGLVGTVWRTELVPGHWRDSRLSEWLQNHDKLHSCQAGFRSRRSRYGHVFGLSHIIQERTRQGLTTWLFFRDAAKAFDTVWRDGMLDSLWEIGFVGTMAHH
jgi:hypothetical protein